MCKLIIYLAYNSMTTFEITIVALCMIGTAMGIGITVYMGWSLFKEVKEDKRLMEEGQKD